MAISLKIIYLTTVLANIWHKRLYFLTAAVFLYSTSWSSPKHLSRSCHNLASLYSWSWTNSYLALGRCYYRRNKHFHSVKLGNCSLLMHYIYSLCFSAGLLNGSLFEFYIHIYTNCHGNWKLFLSFLRCSFKRWDSEWVTRGSWLFFCISPSRTNGWKC